MTRRARSSPCARAPRAWASSAAFALAFGLAGCFPSFDTGGGGHGGATTVSTGSSNATSGVSTSGKGGASASSSQTGPTAASVDVANASSTGTGAPCASGTCYTNPGGSWTGPFVLTASSTCLGGWATGFQVYTSPVPDPCATCTCSPPLTGQCTAFVNFYSMGGCTTFTSQVAFHEGCNQFTPPVGAVGFSVATEGPTPAACVTSSAPNETPYATCTPPITPCGMGNCISATLPDKVCVQTAGPANCPFGFPNGATYHTSPGTCACTGTVTGASCTGPSFTYDPHDNACALGNIVTACTSIIVDAPIQSISYPALQGTGCSVSSSTYEAPAGDVTICCA